MLFSFVILGSIAFSLYSSLVLLVVMNDIKLTNNWFMSFILGYITDCFVLTGLINFLKIKFFVKYILKNQ